MDNAAKQKKRSRTFNETHVFLCILTVSLRHDFRKPHFLVCGRKTWFFLIDFKFEDFESRSLVSKSN